MPKPTVGRIVHFYKSGLDLNGQGAGPYPAIVQQTFPDGPYVNLKVLGWGKDAWDEGSVSEGTMTEGTGNQVGPNARFWVWPPRE
jgi:hypothetical protein